MKKCDLCGRKISSTKYSFGLGCLKKAGHILGIDNIKNLKGESSLNSKVQKVCNKSSLNKEQKELLTNRYLTLKFLEVTDIDYYNNIKDKIKNDINNISPNTSEKDLKTMNTMPLKYAYNIYKLFSNYKKFEDFASNSISDDIQNLDFNLILFAFSSYYNKKPYLSGLLQHIQLSFWNQVILSLNMTGFTCAAKFLKHSLQYKPDDILITDTDEIIDKIKVDVNFKNKLKDIINEYGKNLNFDTNKKNTEKDLKNKSLNYSNTDLFLALNNTNIRVIGNKVNGKWNLYITITDIYDFTDFKELHDYVETHIIKSVAGSTANNLAMVSTSCGLINKYNITIKFSLHDYEV